MFLPLVTVDSHRCFASGGPVCVGHVILHQFFVKLMDLETRFDRIFADKKGEMTQIFGVSKSIVDDLGRTRRIAKRQRCEV